ncbi:WD40 repeat-like protein [Athelia psychrophila]|uniref:Pre-mRNA-processing factor 17 n=1 Tax=Athelia psychrophila TaxID=1759441 RepID=A0A166UZN5_9AGAM|nr:WD40 repeat-like protein [Fibularhizoctonia sp. CBS 109695]
MSDEKHAGARCGSLPPTRCTHPQNDVGATSVAFHQDAATQVWRGNADLRAVELAANASQCHGAPPAGDGLKDPLHQTSLITRPTDTQMNVNIPYADMLLPAQGPENPFSDRGRFAHQNALAGHVEEQSMTEHAFRAQHLTHAILGYSMNPSVDEAAPRFLGDLAKAAAGGFATLDMTRARRGEKKELKRKRGGKGDLDVAEGEGSYAGPWATWDGDEPNSGFLDGFTGGDDDEEEEPEEVAPKAGAGKKSAHKPKRTGAHGEETSIFHGKSMTDYQGRTYMHPPVAEAPGLLSESGGQECFIPKVCTHTWTGHTQAVAVIRLFPGTGHLMLSGSMDTKIKLWDVYTHQNCLRTFHGHVKAVKDLCFNNDGTQFLSCAYDRQMKLWDTETGACLKRFSNGKIPYCIKFHPGQQHVFLAGMSDKKIIQYDMNTGEITQEYDQHLGPVNTITFVDENRRFITTSDDKTIRVWDYDIPVVIKYIAEPYMHSMPAVTLHPSGKYFAAQSMDNQILIYSTDNFRQNRKKRFANHQVAGYACQVGFSPDGKWISSGDGSGNVVFWDWKTGNIKSRLKAHSQVVISHVWLPHETSKVITASWDGLIKLWVRHRRPWFATMC